MEPEDQETWEERAAIMEFDAGMSRAQAERRARQAYQHNPASCTLPLPPPARQTPGYLAYLEFKQNMKPQR